VDRRFDVITVLFAFMLVFMLMRVYMPIGTKVKGKPVKTVSLSLQERFNLQRLNLYAIAVFLFVCVVTGELNTGGLIPMLIAAQVVLLLPVRCVITSQGVGLNNVVFRTWQDFTGFTREARRLVLIGQDGTRPLNIPFLAAHQKEVLPALQRFLPEAKARKEALGAKRAVLG
jgi:hypothetical protein